MPTLRARSPGGLPRPEPRLRPSASQATLAPSIHLDSEPANPRLLELSQAFRRGGTVVVQVPAVARQPHELVPDPVDGRQIDGPGQPSPQLGHETIPLVLRDIVLPLQRIPV